MADAGKRWLITGVSGGLGRLLAEAALARGDSVAGTVRKAEQAAEFAALAPGRAHGVVLDVTDRARIRPAVDEAIARLGGLDVLVNNAGYGLIGAAEELDEDQIDAVIETNLCGTIHVTRAALPELRGHGGTIMNLSSLAGIVGLPASSTYCAAKFGVEGFSEALQLEVAPFGIRVIVVEPGGFRTNFATTSIRTARNPIVAYDATPAGEGRLRITTMGEKINDYMRGDPAKAAAAMIAAVDAPEPPFRLVLGPDALAAIRKKLTRLANNLDAWESTSLGTDLEQAQA